MNIRNTGTWLLYDTMPFVKFKSCAFTYGLTDKMCQSVNSVINDESVSIWEERQLPSSRGLEPSRSREVEPGPLQLVSEIL